MALLEPKAFTVDIDSTEIRAGETIHGQIVPRWEITVSEFQLTLAQNNWPIALAVIPAPGRLSKGQALRFELPTPMTAAPSMTTEHASVDWTMTAARGTSGVRLLKSIDLSVGPVRRQFDLNGFEHPEVLRVARDWEKKTTGSPFSSDWAQIVAEASGRNRHVVPSSVHAGTVLQAGIAQWLGAPIHVAVRPGVGPISLGLVCTIFRIVRCTEDSHVESFPLHEQWQQIVVDSTVELWLPKRGVPSHAAGDSSIHWTLEARSPSGEIIERRPVCALAGPDFDDRMVEHLPKPALCRI